jgi:trigger factor
MSQNIETLGTLERRIDLALPVSEIDREVSARLNKLARTVRMPGFRPGKVPLKMIAASYGPQVQSEVLNDKLGQAFSAVVSESKLRVAGAPRVEAKEGQQGDTFAFSATFEVYPDIKLGDLSAIEVKRAVCPVGDPEIDRTLGIMRKQRARYEPIARPAGDGDRVTVDFTGTLDGTPFDGGSGTDFPFVLGEGRMLPEFETAVRGMSAGDGKAFDLTFPADYRAQQLAGKAARFDVTLKRVEQAILPEVDAEFARALGVADGDVARLRAEVKANLEREVRNRLRARTKESVMDGLLASSTFELPKSLVQADQERLAEMARADLVARGMQAKDAPIPAEIFAAQAERRVRLGLLIGEVLRVHNLSPRQDQVRKAIEEIAQSYEKPAEVIQWYLGNRERVAEVESAVMEDNVVAWVLQNARVADATVAFDELMGHRS